MPPTELKILNQQTLQLGEAKIAYYLLEDNHVYFSQKDFNSYIGLTTPTGKPVLYQNDKSIFFKDKAGDSDIAVPLRNIITVCVGKIEDNIKGDSDPNVLFKCLYILSILSEKGLDKLESEIKSAEPEQEPEPEVKFDDLLAGLMRVPPPKKSK
ncbi:hypothetical protein SAMN05216490_1922 [Mucilaginibacter mallensis]|uniref:Uncharacterized protein n=1 Tax=Mucilaginibacter mallensis TaxID=652787 RepID=A0A1H1VJ84_MUCMA|nr:hypothetical protein [Mucilaginibacter mallensis]SDS84129.1 hypothetical protein SAMN05216490_1922 [Mucilaginibacter mallensis]